jgi:hypothetical protein
MPLKITAEFENWRRVEDFEGAGGWVHYSLLSGVRTALVTLDMAEFRDAPTTAHRGGPGRTRGDRPHPGMQPDWCRIALDGSAAGSANPRSGA